MSCLLRLLCLMAFLMAHHTAYALASEDATQAAFGALLAMPAAAPDSGTWEDLAIRAPGDFDAQTASQEDLIAYLETQRKRGAVFDSYRLKGTLLHHAIRARLQAVALWLLRHGAKPELAVDGRPELDAMGIAIKMGTWRVLDTLRKHPYYARIDAATVLKRYSKVIEESPSAPRALTDRKLFDPSTRASQANLANQLNAFFLEGKPAEASALLLDNPSYQPTPPSCAPALSYKPESPQQGSASLAQWRAAVLALPAAGRSVAWLCAYRFVFTKADADAMLAASGVDPWRDTAQAENALRLSSVNTVWRHKLRDIPANTLAMLLSKPENLTSFLQRASTISLSDLQWTLAMATPVLNTTTTLATVTAWSAALHSSNAQSLADKPERWRLLVQAAPVGRGVATSALMDGIPVAQWSLWFSKGYVLSNENWEYWLTSVATVADLEVAYPLFKVQVPALAERALTLMVADLSNGDGYSRNWDASKLAKADYLVSVGARVVTPYPLAARFRSGATKDGLVAQAISRGWVLDLPITASNGVELLPAPGCKPVVSAALRRSIAAWDQRYVLPTDDYFMDQSFSTLQPFATKTDSECAWLATGGEPGGRKFIYDVDFFAGVNRLTPCTDGNIINAVWSDAARDWVVQKDLSISDSLTRLRMKNSKNEALLEQRSGDGCVPSRAYVYVTKAQAGTVELVAAKRGDVVYDALVQQCDLSELDKCLHVAESSYPKDDSAELAWAAIYLKEERSAFLLALHRLDYKALGQVREAGLFAAWISTGLQRLEKSSLALDERRQRAAWLLAQRSLLAHALSPSTLKSLLAWLPAQDWQPISLTLRCVRRDWGNFVVDAREAKREDVLHRPMIACPVVAKK